MRNNKMLGFIFCLVMCFFLLPQSQVSAATTEYDLSVNGDGSVIATFDDATSVLTISGTGAIKDYSEGATPWQDKASLVKEIKINEGITEIGNNTFYYSLYQGSYIYFKTLEKVSLPNSLTRIGQASFKQSNTTSSLLTSLTIPQNVEVVEKEAFRNQVITTLVFADNSKLKTIKDSAFYNLKKLTGEIVLPSSVESIGGDAFYGCGASKFVCNEGLQTIGSSAFYGSKIEELYISSTVTTIGTDIFRDAQNLKVITNVSKVNQSVNAANYPTNSAPIVYLYSANTNFLALTAKMSDGFTVVYLDEPALSGTLENGIKWTYDPDTKTITFEGEGEIPSYTAGTQPWYGAYYAYGSATRYDFGSVSGIGTGAFSGLSFGSVGNNITYSGVYASDYASTLGSQTGSTVTKAEEVTKTGIYNFVDSVEVVFPDVQPRIVNGEVVSPLRFIFQDLGATVIWNYEKHYAVIQKEENGKKIEIVMKPDSSSMWVNGQEYTNEEIGLDATVVLENGRLLLPGRAIIKAWEFVQFKAVRPSVTLYEDYYYKTSEPVEGGDDKLPNIPTIDDWQETGEILTPDNEEEILSKDDTIGNVDGTNTILLSTMEAPMIWVRVSPILSIHGDSTGTVSVSNDMIVENLSPKCPVVFSDIQIYTANSWSVVSSTTDFANSPIGEKVFSLSIDGVEPSESGHFVLTDSLKSGIKCGESKTLNVEVDTPIMRATEIEQIGVIVYSFRFQTVDD